MTKVSKYNQKSERVSVFHGFPVLEPEALFAGYAALIQCHRLAVPAPDRLCATGSKRRKRESGRWQLFAPRYQPEDTLKGHLTFALKYEGLDLMVLESLFKGIDSREIVNLVKEEPTGRYSRRIWFLYEWLTGEHLDLDDATQGNYVPLVNDRLQYAAVPRDSRRHRVRNNLPGTREFCPLIRRTETLDRFI